MAGKVSTHLMSLFTKHLEKRNEKTLYETPVLYEFSDKRPLPGKKGTHMFVPKNDSNNNLIRGLTEYSIITPSGTSASYYSGVVSGFGDARIYSDFLVSVNEIPSQISDDIHGMTEYAGYKIDDMLALEICGTTATIKPDGSSAKAASSTNLKQRFLFDARATLRRNKAPMYSDGCYWAAVSPEGCHDFFVNTSGGFGPLGAGFMENTAAYQKLETATLGKLGGCRVIETNKLNLHYGGGSTSATDLLSGSASGYAAYVMGPGALAAVDLATARLKTFVKNFGDAGAYDPIDQVMTAGVKFYFCAIGMDVNNRCVRTAHGKDID